jgi:hypothetical protein
MKNVIEKQDCNKCGKMDKSGVCCKPGLCIYVDKLADGHVRQKEYSIDPQIAEKLGEKGYLSLINEMDIAKNKTIMRKNPVLSKIITMMVGGTTRKKLLALGYSYHMIRKASELWADIKDVK